MLATKEKRIAGSLRRAEGRTRLMALAQEGCDRTEQERQLDRLRTYLLDWSQRQREYGPNLGSAGSCLGQYMKSSSPTASELFQKSDGWAAAVVEAAMDDLLEHENGALMRASLRVRYLNEGISRSAAAADRVFQIRVFRHGRLHELSLIECDKLADDAEILLIPIVKRKGLPL